MDEEMQETTTGENSGETQGQAGEAIRDTAGASGDTDASGGAGVSGDTSNASQIAGETGALGDAAGEVTPVSEESVNPEDLIEDRTGKTEGDNHTDVIEDTDDEDEAEDKNKKKKKKKKAKKDKVKNKKKKRKPTMKKIVGVALIAIQLVLMVLSVIEVSGLQLVPLWLMIAVFVVLLLFTAFNYLTQLGRFHLIGKFMTLIWIALLGVVIWLSLAFNSSFKAVADLADTDSQFSVLVRIEDDASEVAATSTYVYGITRGLDSELSELSIAEVMKDDNNVRPIIQQFDNLTSMYDALMSGRVGAIIFNERYRNMMDEIYPTFTKKTKVLATYEPKAVADLLGTKENESKQEKNLKKEAFTVFISANKRTDEAYNGGKSTLNALVVINPTTKAALVLGIPSNALIEATLGGQTGKDTIGNYSQMTIDEAKSVVGSYFGVDVDYCVNVHMDDDMENAVNSSGMDAELALAREVLNSISSRDYVLDGGRAETLADRIRIDADKKCVAKIASLFMLKKSDWNVISYRLNGNQVNYSGNFFNFNSTGCLDVDGERDKVKEYVKTILEG